MQKESADGFASSADPHSEHVLAVLSGRGQLSSDTGGFSPRVLASWRRCVDRHGLEPHRPRTLDVMSSVELRDVMSPLEELVEIATPEIDRFFARVAAIGAIVTLNDAGGRTLLLRCPSAMAREVGTAGLHLGSIWSESSQGTNGIGVCLEEKSAISVVAGDHFCTHLIDLSCTVAPIFYAEGHLAAVLNVTTSRPGAAEQHLLLREMVTAATTRIENLWFERRHGAADCMLRLSRFKDFNDLSSEARIALDMSGRIVAATANARATLTTDSEALVGRASDRLFGISDTLLREQGPQGIRLPRGDGIAVYLKTGEAAARRAGGATGAFQAERRRAAAAEPAPGRVPERSAPRHQVVLRGTPDFMRQIETVQKLVDRRLPVLIQGETGTGKSVLARALHDRSAHSAARFVSVNCAAIPAELIESELFGYRPGAFTGAARQGSRGLLVEADGGTLFLDEIGDMPIALQSRLLHVLSDGEFVPIGAVVPVKVSIALVSATLHDLAGRVKAGLFREDLYFRLAGATLSLPPLRERADRKSLLQSVLAAEANAHGRPGMTLAPDVQELLHRYSWPGNVRELQHLLRYAVTVCAGEQIGLGDLPWRWASATADTASAREQLEREETERMLAQCGWNVSLAAQRLNISRATLHRRIAQFELKRPTH